MGDFVGEDEGQAEGWAVGLPEGVLVGAPLVGASVGYAVVGLGDG